MLYIVLVLVLTALTMVITALVTANALWAWISIGLSALAGVLLTIEWWRRRSVDEAEAAVESEGDAADSVDPVDIDLTASDEIGTDEDEKAREGKDTEPAASDEAGAEQRDVENRTALLPVSGRLDGADEDPPEESTDATDLLIVVELDIEVQVVDERPRYHLGECHWIENRDTIPVPVREARELGFTPCARCGPDARLAAGHRGKRALRK